MYIKKPLLFLDKNLINESWESVMNSFLEMEGNSSFKVATEITKAISQLRNLYIVIKSMIRFCMIITPSMKGKYGDVCSENINKLHLLGYNVDISSSEKYKESLNRCEKKSNNIITQIALKKKELEYVLPKKSGNQGITFEREIAMISYCLKFSVPKDITLKQYCEYKKIIQSINKKNS